MRTRFFMRFISLCPKPGAAVLLVALVIACGSFGAPAVSPDQAGPNDLDNTPEGHLARAHEAFNLKRLQQAEREFRAALALDPRLTVRARFPLAVVLFDLQERDEARREFEAVRAETGDDPNVDYYLGRLDLMEGDLESAIRNLTAAASAPPFPDAPYYLGYAYMKKGDTRSAEQWLRKAVDAAPRDFRVHERLGLLYRAMGRNEEAEKALARASELHQEDILATQEALNCGRSLDTDPLAKAREICRKLFNPSDLGSLVSLGTLYGQHGNYADAVEPFRLAAELEPDSYEMQYNLGLTYFRLKRYSDARASLEKAAALRPDMFEVNAPLGAALYVLGEDATAYRVLDRANRLKAGNSDVSGLLCKTAVNLATQSLQKQDVASARAYLLRALQACPDDPELHRRLAEAYEVAGDQAAARRERDQAARLTAH